LNQSTARTIATTLKKRKAVSEQKPEKAADKVVPAGKGKKDSKKVQPPMKKIRVEILNEPVDLEYDDRTKQPADKTSNSPSMLGSIPQALKSSNTSNTNAILVELTNAI
jgi:hypothetical protein